MFAIFRVKCDKYHIGYKMKKFGDTLKDIMIEKDISDRWLSRAIDRLFDQGITPGTIGKYRRGLVTPSPNNAMKILNTLNHHFKLGLTLDGIFSPKKMNDIRVKEEKGSYTPTIRKEGIVEIPLFPVGAELLSALNQSKNGYSIDVSMAKERTLVPEGLAHEGVFATKVDHLFNCDEEYRFLIVWPWEGQTKKNGVILFTTDPPKEFFLRRILYQEDEKLFLKKPYNGNNIITTNSVVILGEVRFKIEEI